MKHQFYRWCKYLNTNPSELLKEHVPGYKTYAPFHVADDQYSHIIDILKSTITSILSDKEKDSILFRAVREITGLKYFYLQNDSDCHGALGYAAHYVGKNPNPDELDELTVRLREAFKVIERDFVVVPESWAVKL